MFPPLFEHTQQTRCATRPKLMRIQASRTTPALHPSPWEHILPPRCFCQCISVLIGFISASPLQSGRPQSKPFFAEPVTFTYLWRAWTRALSDCLHHAIVQSCRTENGLLVNMKIFAWLVHSSSEPMPSIATMEFSEVFQFSASYLQKLTRKSAQNVKYCSGKLCYLTPSASQHTTDGE